MVLRRAIFAANVAKVQAHNASPSSFKMAVNAFADLTGEEFKARYASGLRASAHKVRNLNASLLNAAAPPTSVDWTTKGAVTPVKNQEQCGSCWAFSTTGSTEGAVFIATGVLTSLSEQQLMDCSQKEGNQSCNGGLMDDAFQFILDNKGICSEASYPYIAADEACKKTCTPVATIKSFSDVPANSETALMAGASSRRAREREREGGRGARSRAARPTHRTFSLPPRAHPPPSLPTSPRPRPPPCAAIVNQPVSVAVEADQNSFQLYSGGVMDAACGTNLDHGVLAVGYDTDAASGKDYYKVKNSWGAAWGQAGYIWLARGAKFNPAGQCGIQMMASYPTA